MIVSLPYGDLKTKYAPNDKGAYTLFVSFSDLIGLINPANPTVTHRLINERIANTIRRKTIDACKYIAVNQVLTYMDNIHVDTRINTMYIMQELQKTFKDYLD